MKSGNKNRFKLNIPGLVIIEGRAPGITKKERFWLIAGSMVLVIVVLIILKNYALPVCGLKAIGQLISLVLKKINLRSP